MGNAAFCRDAYYVDAHKALSEYLGRSFGWVTSGTIRENIGYDAANIGYDAATVRKVCQMYPSVYVSSTEGYKHHTRASRREIQHCVTTLLSRAEKITSRAAALSSRLL
jgi:hypothetical protein